MNRTFTDHQEEATHNLSTQLYERAGQEKVTVKKGEKVSSSQSDFSTFTKSSAASLSNIFSFSSSSSSSSIQCNFTLILNGSRFFHLVIRFAKQVKVSMCLFFSFLSVCEGGKRNKLSDSKLFMDRIGDWHTHTYIHIEREKRKETQTHRKRNCRFNLSDQTGQRAREHAMVLRVDELV